MKKSTSVLSMTDMIGTHGVRPVTPPAPKPTDKTTTTITEDKQASKQASTPLLKKKFYTIYTTKGLFLANRRGTVPLSCVKAAS